MTSVCRNDKHTGTKQVCGMINMAPKVCGAYCLTKNKIIHEVIKVVQIMSELSLIKKKLTYLFMYAGLDFHL